MKILILLITTVLLLTANAEAETRNLVASWYSVDSLKQEGTWDRTHGLMANGKVFSDTGLTCACNLYPLGAWLLVTAIPGGNSVIVRNTDRISKRFGKTRIDLSKKAMETLGGQRALIQGLLSVTVTELK